VTDSVNNITCDYLFMDQDYYMGVSLDPRYLFPLDSGNIQYGTQTKLMTFDLSTQPVVNSSNLAFIIGLSVGGFALFLIVICIIGCCIKN